MWVPKHVGVPLLQSSPSESVCHLALLMSACRNWAGHWLLLSLRGGEPFASGLGAPASCQHPRNWQRDQSAGRRSSPKAFAVLDATATFASGDAASPRFPHAPSVRGQHRLTATLGLCDSWGTKLPGSLFRSCFAIRESRQLCNAQKLCRTKTLPIFTLKK